MKKSHLKLLNFLKKYKGPQWYSNDRQTRKLVDKLVARNLVIKNKTRLDNGYIYREVKLINA
jgi:hypothetical protein